MRHTVEILDTAGTHCFPAMRQLSIQTGRAFVLVFSVDSLQSFYETINLYELITKIRGKHHSLSHDCPASSSCTIRQFIFTAFLDIIDIHQLLL